MIQSTLTKRIEFSASHRYVNADWDETRNRETFGPCFQEHGHNYLLDVNLGGRVDPVTGMIINLYDLKHIATDVLEEFDHKHLNVDTPYFERLIPTTENLALVLWRKFREHPETQGVNVVRLSGGKNLWIEVHTPKGTSPASKENEEPSEALVTRQYALIVGRHFPASPSDTWHLSLDVTVRGPIDPVTGRVTDIAALDELVNNQVLQRFSGINLSQHPQFASQPVTLSTLAKELWPHLIAVSGGQLDKLKLHDQRGLTLEYSVVPQ